MKIHIQDAWMLLCIALTIILILVFIMSLQGRRFFTNDVVIRKFNIIDLELPSSVNELPNLIKGIYALPEKQKNQTISSLKGQLYLDFLLMPAAYLAIFLLCMKVSWKMNLGWLFASLAWLQIVAFIFNVIENIYLLEKIRPDIVPESESAHKTFRTMEIVKWGIPLVATICSLSAIIYFWLVGRYSLESLKYILIILGEAIVFFIAVSVSKRNKSNDDTIPAA